MHSKDINSNTSPTSSSRQYNTNKSWIDDIPPCEKSGIGVSENKIICNDGCQTQEHTFEDRSFYCHLDNGTFLYGIFDGHLGPRAADFCLQRMAAEIMLGQLTEKKNDDEIKDVIRQAYISVERSYFDSINDLLAERMSLQCELPDCLNAFDAYQKYPHVFEKLKSLNYELSSGTSAVIALIHSNKLYVANVGNSRALLCRTDSNGVLRVVQLSVDHDLRNEDELLRLMQLEIDMNHLKYGTQIGNQETTRCLGNYLVKAGFREHKELQSALGEPVIAEPEIHGGINLDDSCRFLLLMSAGMYKCLEEVIPANDVNKYIAQMIVEQFRLQPNLDSVAQMVVDKTVELHQEHVLKSISAEGSITDKREDITLIVRNFNYPLKNVVYINTNASDITTNNTNSTNSTEHSINDDTNNSDKRIKAYVDFTIYYNNIKFRNNNL